MVVVIAEENMIFRFSGGNSVILFLLRHRVDEVFCELIDVRFDEVGTVVVEDFIRRLPFGFSLEQVLPIAEKLESGTPEGVNVATSILFHDDLLSSGLLFIDMRILVVEGEEQ